MKHTEGPWNAGGSFNDQPQISTEKTGKTIALCYSHGQPEGHRLGKPGRECTEAEANAHLIAAAPELLEATKEALNAINQRLDIDGGKTGAFPSEMKAVILLEKAIRKAEGA